jgi:hypothetical protein
MGRAQAPIHKGDDCCSQARHPALGNLVAEPDADAGMVNLDESDQPGRDVDEEVAALEVDARVLPVAEGS